MPILVREPIKGTKENVVNVVNYICDEAKSVDEKYIFSNCENKNEFLKNLNSNNKDKRKNNYSGYQYIISFKPLTITLDILKEIAEIFSELAFSDYDYIAALHSDKEHLHAHIVLNNINNRTGKKYHSNIKDYFDLRNTLNVICKEKGIDELEIEIKDSENSLYKNLKNEIKENMNLAKTYEQFCDLMSVKYKVINISDEDGKYLSFIDKSDPNNKIIRSHVLNKKYSRYELKKFFDIKNEKNIEQNRPNKKLTKEQNFLKNAIINSLKVATTEKEFFESMQRQMYEYKIENRKQLKETLYFKHINNNKWIATHRLGEDFQFKKLKLKINNNAKQQQEIQKNENNIDKIITNNKDNSQNINNFEKKKLQDLKNTIDKNISISLEYKMFIDKMNQDGYIVKNIFEEDGKYLAFKNTKTKFIRTYKLGERYKRYEIQKRIINNIIEEIKKQNSNRDRLIDALKKELKYLDNSDIEIILKLLKKENINIHEHKENINKDKSLEEKNQNNYRYFDFDI